jgi:cell volume regulation protein A
METLLIWVGAFLLAAILASKASSRLGIPALLLFLALGMLAGEDGLGGIPFSDAQLTQSIGVVALSLILFGGGFSTDWHEVRPLFARGLSLATVGVALTASVVGVFAMWVFRLPLTEGMLLGSILSSTDAAAVFAVLRSKGITLKSRIGPLLELESGSNDPMAVFLTVFLIRWLTGGSVDPATLAQSFLWQMAGGGLIGFGIGKGTAWLINQIDLEAEGLYPALTVAAAALAFGIAEAMGANGFLSVYLAGLVLGEADILHKKSLMRFHDGLAWLMQIAMFLALGLLVFPTRLAPVILPSLAIAAVLIFLARPVGVFVALAFARMQTRHKLMVSWVGLRGAVPIVLATYPQVAGLANADLFFNVVFFAVLTSALIQGTTLGAVAGWLGVRGIPPLQPAFPVESAGLRSGSQLIEVEARSELVTGRAIVELGLPRSALVVVISRGVDFVIPRGATIIERGDRIQLLAPRWQEAQLRRMFEGDGKSEE